MRFNKVTIALVLILLLAAILRLTYLSIIPPAIGGDELDYIVTAKAFFLTGKDISGTLSPLSVLLFQYPPFDAPKAELPYLLLMPIVGPLPFSLFTSRILYAICSIATVYVLYLVTKRLLNQPIAVITAFLSAVNPWLIYLGRTSYEPTLALFFYLLGFYIVLITESWNIFWSLPIFILAFYSYIGTKLIFLPFIVLCLVYCYIYVVKKQFLKQYLIYFGISILFIFVFLFLLKQHPANSRLSEIYMPFSSDIARKVNDVRKSSMASPLMPLFENKFTIYGRNLLSRFFAIFSGGYLFTSGDTFFNIWENGLFYCTSFIFMIIGFGWLFWKRRVLLLFICLFILLSTLPQVFHITPSNFTPHVMLMFPFMLILAAAGMYYVITMMGTAKARNITGIVIIGTYMVLLLNFINIYFFEFPMHDPFDFHVRVLSKYITLANESHQPVAVGSNLSVDLFKKYLFYTNSYTKDNARIIQQSFVSKKYHLNNVTFRSCLPTHPDKYSIGVEDAKCRNGTSGGHHNSISQLSDGGEIYQIYNDTICNSYQLYRYPTNITLSDFNIESMSREEFCKKYVSSL